MKKLLILIVALGISCGVLADENPEQGTLKLDMAEWCKTIQGEHFFSAYHPGEANRIKVEKGTLNEDTPGTGLKCIAKEDSAGGRMFLHIGELINSQRGETTVAGIGYQYELLAYVTFP